MKSVVSVDDRPPPPLPEIAFSGRSNVGKSSLLNVLLRRKRLAMTSGRPGKTQTLNFYDVDGACWFVDLPGYGYARAPAALRRAWRPMVEGYLRGSPDLAGVVQLVDSRHDPTPEDLHFSSVYSLSREDAGKIRALLLNAIERAEPILRASPEEEVFGIGVDLFRI